MTARRWAVATLAAPLLLGGPAHAATPRPLSFSAGESRYEVPPDGFESIAFKPEQGLELCMTDAVEEKVGSFTRDHVGGVVKIAIGETEVTQLQIMEPYEGGCITWPIHPVVAANYIAMLTGEAP